jgi:hypothetical protein
MFNLALKLDLINLMQNKLIAFPKIFLTSNWGYVKKISIGKRKMGQLTLSNLNSGRNFWWWWTKICPLSLVDR